MNMRMSDIRLEVEPPRLPEAIPVFDVTAPSFEDRRGAMERLGEVLSLGEMRRAAVDHGVVMGNERGHIEFFGASGAVWGSDGTASAEHENELREWPGLKKAKRGDRRASLDAQSSRQVLSEARRVLSDTGLIGRDAEVSESVELDQVARLNGKGEEVSYGAGTATVKMSYAVDGVPVRGAGAKSLVFADPVGRGRLRVIGAFHAWRPLGGVRLVKMGALDKALAVGFSRDPELTMYHRAGHTVRVTKLELCYLALPAFARQEYLFPAFQIEGEVSGAKRGGGFNFGRYHHAVAPKAYAAADLYAPYLVVNPDGISARGRG